jgi:CRP-like cAMP-binding protein
VIQEKVREFFQKFPIEEYRKGDIIIFANMNLSSVFYIETGTVAEYDIAAKGARTVLNTFKPEAFFPMSNAVNGVDTPYFFEAERPTRLHRAPAGEVVDFIKQNPDVLYDLLQRTYRGTDGLLARMSEIMHGDAESQILRELEIILMRFGSEPDEDGSRLTRKVFEIELAERTGLARETVSRAIQRLKAKQLLQVKRGRYVLLLKK